MAFNRRSKETTDLDYLTESKFNSKLLLQRHAAFENQRYPLKSDDDKQYKTTASINYSSIPFLQIENGENEAGGNYVGFANLPNQIYRKCVKKGFDFNLMVAGHSGLGKSTFINNMFLTDIYSATHPGPSKRDVNTVRVNKMQVSLNEGGVQLNLSLVDTPGFGDAIDNSNCWQPIMEYIDAQYSAYLNGESGLKRFSVIDNRVHCCLYFISPNGHRLEALDIEFMKRLHNKVNIVIVIAKGDTLTVEECNEFKKVILHEITQNKINIYDFPETEDEEENKILRNLKKRMPFAVVGSNAFVDVQGKKVRGRMYPWGTVEVDNLEHNDSQALRSLLLRTHIFDLIETTRNVHYENFRYNRLVSLVGCSDKNNNIFANNKSPLKYLQDESEKHGLKLNLIKVKMEDEFETNVNENQRRLEQAEDELKNKTKELKKILEDEENEFRLRQLAFAAEKEEWEEQHREPEVESKTPKKRRSIFAKSD